MGNRVLEPLYVGFDMGLCVKVSQARKYFVLWELFLG